MKQRKTNQCRLLPVRLSILIAAGALAALLVACGTYIFLSKGLPDRPAEMLRYPVADFKFVFGSGNLDDSLLHVDQFADGYALLSSGPVSLQAANYRVLGYTWMPSRLPQELAFFWRRADQPQTVLRTEITKHGEQFLDLSSETQWSGEITEIGFLVAGENGEPVGIGDASLIPDSLYIRLQLTLQAWMTTEVRSQKSINFLYGGYYPQVVSLPLLVSAWLVITLVILWIMSRFGNGIGSRQLLMTTFLLFLYAWMLLDIRWAAENLEQTDLSLGTRWQLDEQLRASNDSDGEVYQYVQYLKSTILNNRNSRILIVGDADTADYYMLRAKYFLLPQSANVVRHFAKDLAPESLDFVIFFGYEANIVNVSGWNQSWQSSLVKVESGDWGTVFRVKQ